MRKIKYILFLLLVLPIGVKANSIGLICPTTNIKSSSDFSCTIFGPEYCTELSFELVLPEGFTYKNTKIGENYTLNNNNNIFNYTGSGLHGRVVSVINITAPSLNEKSKFDISLKSIKYKYTATDELKEQDILTRSVTINATTTTTSTTTTTTTTTSKVIENEYILTLDANGGIIENNSVSCKTKDSCEIDLTKLKSPTKEGLTFIGWSENNNCQNVFNDSYILKNDTRIYACYKNPTSASLFLDNITINNENLKDFSKFKNEYEINIKSDIEDININATSSDENINITINEPDNYIMGKNEVTITLTKEDIISTYKLIINKTTDDIVETPKALLKDLIIDGYKLDFNSQKFHYKLKINYDVKSLKITPIVSNLQDLYMIRGNEILKDGSIVRIYVYDDESNKNEYTINIAKKTFIEQYKTSIIITISIIIALLIYLIVGIKKGRFFKKLTNEDENNKKIEIKEKKTKLKKEKKPKKEKKSKKDKNTEIKEEVEILDI